MTDGPRRARTPELRELPRHTNQKDTNNQIITKINGIEIDTCEAKLT